MTTVQAQRQDMLHEIVVQGQEGMAPRVIAGEWARRLALPDGVRITVYTPQALTRRQRFVAHCGGVTSLQHYAAVLHASAVEDVLQHADRSLDAWEMLQAGRQAGALPSEVTAATVKQAARLLTREGRAYVGPVRDTWRAARVEERAA